MSERLATEIISATRDDRILWNNAAGPGETPRFEATLPSSDLQLARTRQGWRLTATKARRGFDVVPVPGEADLIITASQEQSERLRPLAKDSVARRSRSRNRRIMNVARATGHRTNNPGPLDNAMEHLVISLLAMRPPDTANVHARDPWRISAPGPGKMKMGHEGPPTRKRRPATPESRTGPRSPQDVKTKAGAPTRTEEATKAPEAKTKGRRPDKHLDGHEGPWT